MAAAALSPVDTISTQDVSRLCLTRALVHGHVAIGDCAGETIDRSLYHGRIYSNKAPGESVLAIPAAEAVRLPPPARWAGEGDLRVWAVRLATSGIAFVLLALAVGRMTEGLAPGTGAPSLVAFALGTLVLPFAATTFDHVPAAALGFGAFALAWRRQPALAGLAAGTALLVEYQAALILVAVGAYALAQGRRTLVRFAAGALPGAALLGAYDWIAFGAPWHNPLRYSFNRYEQEHTSGLLGLHAPTLHGTKLVFVGDRGLVWSMPVAFAAAAGLVLLWRRGLRAEAAVCGAVTAVFVVASCGYFVPYGGTSPGPRFLVPALPFLALGLAPAFARWRLPTLALAAVSVVATTTLALTWALAPEFAAYRGSVWGELARLPRDRGHARLVDELAKNVLVWAGPNRIAAAALVSACAAATFAYSAVSCSRWCRPRRARSRP